MSVNGVEIEVGQKWMTRGGRLVEVFEHDGSNTEWPWLVKWGAGHEWVNACGRAVCALNLQQCDVVRLVEKAPKVWPPANDKTQPRTALPDGLSETPPSAPDILDAAAGHLRDRAATNDKPEGERSMAQTVAIFNLHHGTSLTAAQGWHFMQVLKDVRTFTNTVKPHRDSIEDGVSYAALKGEALLQGGAQ